jgi:RNA polymerase sigma factor (sigma-70 family)
MQDTTKIDVQDELLGLLVESSRGNEKAFEQLYKKTSGRLYGVAFQILPRKDWAEDVVQEAYVRIWHNASEYLAERGSVLTWMITILRYRAIDKLRASRRMPAHEQLHDEHYEGDTDPFRMIEFSADRQVLRGCLDTLVEKQRQSIALAFYQGFTHEQLSEHYAAPLGTVKSWVRRGLMSLKRCLSNGLS